MSDPTDERLPFTEKPGRLFWAALGTEMPLPFVHEGRFTNGWPSGWLSLMSYESRTDPVLCADRAEVATENITVATQWEPIRTLATAQTRIWSFGRRVMTLMRRVVGPYPVRFMIGWESEDSMDIVVARQVVLDDEGRCRLEQPYTSVPPDTRGWLRRLLDRLLRRRLAVQREQHPLFEVYRVGELRQV